MCERGERGDILYLPLSRKRVGVRHRERKRDVKGERGDRAVEREIQRQRKKEKKKGRQTPR